MIAKLRRWLGARPWLAWVAVGLAAALLAWDLVRVWSITNHHDLDVFMLAARRLLAGENIYADTGPFQQALLAGTFSMKDDSVVWPYAYAPLIALLFTPLTALPVAWVQAGWWVLNVLALLLGCWLTLRAIGPTRPWLLALTLLILCRFDPAVVGLRLGQIEIVQFLLLAGSLYLVSRGRERGAGLLLGLAGALKVFPLALAVLFLWRRRWRAALWSLVTAGLLIVGSFALVGGDVLHDYIAFSGLYGIGGAFAAFPLNQSWNGFFSRNLMANVFTASLKGWDLPGLARALTLGADLIVVAVSAWVTASRRGWPERPDEATRQDMALEYGLGIVALLLISPHSQVYTYVWVLIPVIVGLGYLSSEDGGRAWGWIGLLAAYLLFGRAYALFIPGLTRFVQAHYLFGATLLWLLLVVWVRARRAES